MDHQAARSTAWSPYTELMTAIRPQSRGSAVRRSGLAPAEGADQTCHICGQTSNCDWSIIEPVASTAFPRPDSVI